MHVSAAPPTSPVPTATCDIEAQARPAAHPPLPIDGLEQAAADRRQMKVWTMGLAGGFCLAIFPFTPGLVANCQPDHNPGWQCGARAASFVAACGAALIGVQAGVALWRTRRR